MPYVPVAELAQYVGKELGRSEWLTIDQERINLFAEATGDFQFIHVDPEKAAKTPFGGTIAHGFLTLSLIPKLIEDILDHYEHHMHFLHLQRENGGGDSGMPNPGAAPTP